MRLVSLELEHFRRFADATLIDLVPSVVALIGPNEAGKSTILNALQYLNRNDDLTQSQRSRDSSEDDEVVIRATYLLDPSDHDALSGIHTGRHVKRYSFACHLEGATTKGYYTLEPHPRRDLKPRAGLASRLQALVEQERILTHFTQIDGLTISQAYEDAIQALRSQADSLDDSEVDQVRRFADALLRFPNLREIKQPDLSASEISIPLHEVLQELRTLEEAPSPSQQAAEILGRRRPNFRFFSEDDRSLQTTYSLDEFASPPRALSNLATLAGLDLNRLSQYSSSEHAGQRATLLQRANNQLADRFRNLWPQHELTILLVYNQPNLEITISSPTGEYSLVTERSDGLRSFVALRAFLATSDESVPPILLVDEAETHLHYDAQANLVDMFAKQTLASKVVYTTHSAGCLPQDLGYGIRVVAPIEGADRSTIRKSIWDGKVAGFSPLVFAMGATTFAFLPARNVLLAEGESDAMLLPTILREAIGRSLTFQIAPGISNTAIRNLSNLRSEGGSVLFLVDGDAGGENLHRHLINVDVPARDILSLSDEVGSGMVLEDLIDPRLYVAAANSVLSHYYDGPERLEVDDLISPNCPGSLKVWCERHHISVPYKNAICQELLDRKAATLREGSNLQLLNPTARPQVVKLARKLLKKFPQLPSYGE